MCVCVGTVTEVICKKTLFAQRSQNAALLCFFFFFICISKNEALLLYKYKYILYIKNKKYTRRNECQKCLNYFKHCVWLPLLVIIIFVMPRECVIFFFCINITMNTTITIITVLLCDDSDDNNPFVSTH